MHFVTVTIFFGEIRFISVTN